MQTANIVSPEEWVAACREFLVREKAFTKARDDLSTARRELPWVRVEKDYVFGALGGEKSLDDLFDGRDQLMIYHFMLGPGWKQGCPSCSYLADQFNPAVIHLENRDVSFVSVSRAPLDEIEVFRKRMGWSFPWVSSFDSDFNRDFNVTFGQAEIDAGKTYYNYKVTQFPEQEAPGLSVFAKGDDGAIYHTYSTYARGLDIFITAYNFLDHAPKGRDEGDLPYSMAWIRHHDRYGA
ncbi:MAG: putative dithiol-disulfide oxidoreductase (DUF899 family) [Paracoccaceae bacterium]|jgi:predicted dithiol-disulfide oxidoreductase (DUF899 family)